MITGVITILDIASRFGREVNGLLEMDARR
jgi:hypothetical protein